MADQKQPETAPESPVAPARSPAAMPAGGVHLLRFQVATIDQAMALARSLTKTAAIGRDITAEAALAVMLIGQELGLPAMESLRSIRLYHGRPYISADLMVALVLRSGRAHYFRVVTSTDQECTYETLRCDCAVPAQCTVTADTARHRGHLKAEAMDTDPATTIRHLCASELAQREYPDVILGLSPFEDLTAVHPKESPSAKPAGTNAPADDEQPMTQERMRTFWSRARKVCTDCGVPKDDIDTCIHDCVLERYDALSIARMPLRNARDFIDSDGWRPKLSAQVQAWVARHQGKQPAEATAPEPPDGDLTHGD